MNKEAQDAIRKVLKEAGEHERFFDFSDAEWLTWMIERAYMLADRKAESRILSPSEKTPGAMRLIADNRATKNILE